MTRRIVLADGGTVGHMNPLLTTVLTSRKRSFTINVLGTREGLESDLVSAVGFGLSVTGKASFPRRPDLEALCFPGKRRCVVAVCEDVVRGAECVIGFGGYVLTPAYRAATRLSVPIVIHEQSARPGLTNRVGARSAALVALTFDNTPLVARQGRTEVTDLPLCPAIVQLAHKRLDPSPARQARIKAAARLKVNPNLPTLLITGGSLRALNLNRALSQTAERLPESVQVIHLAGRGKDGSIHETIRATGVEERWLVYDYLKTMEDALALADLVVCCSSAGTVAEMAALGLPCTYVPLSIGNGEQRLSAHRHVGSGGAILVESSELNAGYTASHVFPLLGSERPKAMAEASRGQGRTRAASDFVNLIESVIGES